VIGMGRSYTGEQSECEKAVERAPSRLRNREVFEFDVVGCLMHRLNAMIPVASK